MVTKFENSQLTYNLMAAGMLKGYSLPGISSDAGHASRAGNT